MKKLWPPIPPVVLILAAALPTQWLAAQAKGGDNPNARPPVTQADVRIVQRAREILSCREV